MKAIGEITAWAIVVGCLALILMIAGCRTGPCHKMPEPNVTGKSVKVCCDSPETARIFSVHSGAWYPCGPDWKECLTPDGIAQLAEWRKKVCGK